MTTGSGKVVHVPPRPNSQWKFFSLSAFVWAASGVILMRRHPIEALQQPAMVISCLGALPGLLAWLTFGRRTYRAARWDDIAKTVSVSAMSSGRRFLPILIPDDQFHAIAEMPDGLGTEPVEGSFLCLRHSEAKWWTGPAMLVQYAASAGLIWSYWLAGYNYTACLVLPASVAGMILAFVLMFAGGPWCAIDVTKSGCFLDDAARNLRLSATPMRIVQAYPERDKLAVVLEGGATVALGFPSGSLSPACQRDILLDLLRHHGVGMSAATPDEHRRTDSKGHA